MSEINSSLIGFLKKKSLFPSSPEKMKKQRQLSRDQKGINQSQHSQTGLHYNPEQKTNKNQKSMSNLLKNNSAQQFHQVDIQTASLNSLAMDSPIRYQSNISPLARDSKNAKRNFSFLNRTQEPIKTRNEAPIDQTSKNIWTGIISKAITFESARLESSQCLDGMSVKLQTEISSINYKIDMFRSKITQILEQQFENLKQKIYQMVDKVIEESESTIKQYLKLQEQSYAQQLLIMRQNLIKEYEKVQTMKDQINRPNWRKVAGELLSTELEQRVQQMVLKSRSLAIKQWQLRNLGEENLPKLEKELRNIFKLTST